MHDELDVTSQKSNDRSDAAEHYPDVGIFGDLTDSVGSTRWLRQMVIFSIGVFTIIYAGTVLLASPDYTPSPMTTEESLSVADNAETPGQQPAEIVADTPTEIIEPPAGPTRREETVKLRRGQTLIQALKKAGVPSREAYSALATLGEEMDMRRVLPGQELNIVWMGDDSKNFEGLWMRKGFDQRVDVTKNEGGFVSAVEALAVQPITRFSSGTITDSLFMTAEREGVPPGVIVDMIRMYSFDVDWEREIRPGDSFEVYFARSLNTTFGDLRDDHIISARLTILNGNNPDRVLELNRFEDSTGKVDYYTDDGKSARKALMKTPIDGAVLTSRFNPNRKHPVLGYTRAHKGSDFRARTGTPIMASGDGIVERASYYGSAGNHVRIRHNSTYTTTYSHLSKFGKGIRKGARVKQGQIIGLAGATGRVTGPHLHYEVIVNGTHVNPMTLKLPTGKTLKGADLVAFEEHLTQMEAERGASQKAIEAIKIIRAESSSVDPRENKMARISTN